jgi:hypothetical protein
MNVIKTSSKVRQTQNCAPIDRLSTGKQIVEHAGGTLPLDLRLRVLAAVAGLRQ